MSGKGRRADFRRWAVLAARAAAGKKAREISVYDVRGESDVADFVVLSEVDSSAQMRAVEGAIEEALGAGGLSALRRDGRATDRWRALDYGGMIVHLLLPEAREFYRLEHLWERPKKVRW